MRLSRRPTSNRQQRITLNLTSMIDVTFLLLTYFLLTSVLAKPEDKLTSALQTQSDGAAQISDFQPQVVHVLLQGEQPIYRVGSQNLTRREHLATVLSPLPKTEGIIINVSDGVPVGFAIAAMQEAHNAGFDQVTYVPQR